MADQKAGDNLGVGTLNDGNSGAPTGAPAGPSSGGGGGTPSPSGTSGTPAGTGTPTGTGGNPGSTATASPPSPFPPGSNLSTALDSFLNKGGDGLPSYEDVVGIFIATKVGMDEIKRQNPQIADADFKAEVDSLKDYYMNGAGKEALEGMYKDLKAALGKAKETAVKLPITATQAIASSVLPGTIGIGVPNFAKMALDLKVNTGQIKEVINDFLVTVATVLKLAGQLGLSNSGPIKQLGNIAQPLLKSAQKMEDAEKKADAKEEEANAEPFEVVIMSATYTEDDAISAADLWGVSYPLSDDDMSKIEEKLEAYRREPRNDATDAALTELMLILKYNQWYLENKNN
jgi:hypothetical protein